MKRKLYVEQVGGLGNQIFQGVAAIALAKKGNYEPIAFTNNSKLTNNHGSSSEKLEWKAIKHQRLNVALLPLITLGFRLAAIFPNQEFGFLSIRFYAPSEVGHSIDSVRGTIVFLRGYFQSYLYFEQLSGAELPKLRNPSLAYKRAEEICIASQPLGLHIRRGDFADSKNPHGIISLSYYAAATKALGAHENIEMAPWVFTDDLGLVTEEIKRWYPNAFFPSREFSLTTPEELFLMSRLKQLVVGNSSFAIVGALLSQANSSCNQVKVICPENPFRRMPTPIGLFPPGWSRMPCKFE